MGLALFGLTLSPEKINLIRSKGIKQVVILLDTGEEKTAYEMAKLVRSSGMEVYIANCPYGTKDPGDATVLQLCNSLKKKWEGRRFKRKFNCSELKGHNVRSR